MITTAFTQIDRRIFNDELDEALIWSTAQAKSLLKEVNLNNNERWIKLTKAISERYPRIGHKAGVFLAATAALAAEIGV